MLISGRTLEKVERVAQTIRQTGGSAEAAVTDATSEPDIIRLFDRASAAGVFRPKGVLTAATRPG